MGRYAGAKDAKIMDKGTKCSDGKHLLELRGISVSENGKNGDYYVAEFKVISSDSASDETGRQKDPPGADRVWTQALIKKNEYLPKLKAFMYAVLGYDRKNPDDAKLLPDIDNEIEKILQDSEDVSDPLGVRGRKVWAQTRAILTDAGKKRGETTPNFVLYEFAPGQADKLF